MMTQHVLSPAQIMARQVCAAGTVVEHGHSFALHDKINGQINELECVEENQSKLLVVFSMAKMANLRHSAVTVEEQLRLGIQQQFSASKPLPLKSMSVAKSNKTAVFGLSGWWQSGRHSSAEAESATV